ncbi:MAG: hypothetical protein IE933_14890 [Sphingomonadales bacterium]|nr:hypothetical protein [Sphingomonadales bacterium]MBD3775185.1 hypothetical protein [Paracoccaceae bacterium]MBD3813996.1 hypothetical protein [Betaproteobacteria bacterium]
MTPNASSTSQPAAEPQRLRASSSQMSVQWAALQDAAGAVATLAGLATEKPSPTVRNFPALIRDAGGWRLDLAERGIADLTAIMQPGLTALLAVNARGQDATAAALTLWREFHAARAAILGLVPQDGNLGPRRSA